MTTPFLMRLLIATLAGFYTIVCGAAGTAAEDAARIASELVDTASPTKESKQQFFQRFGPSYRRLAATELMAQEVVGDVWLTFSSSQQAEFTQLYEKIVLAALHGAYDAALPARFALVGVVEHLNRRKTGSMKRRCDLLLKEECMFYFAKAKANDMVVEYHLIETKSGWQVVDLLINGMSVQATYAPLIQEALGVGTEHALEQLRMRVSRF